jgi:PIN domain
MLRYLLDTNVLSDLLRNPGGRAVRRLAVVGETAVCTSIVVACELRYGAAKKSSSRLSERVEILRTTRLASISSAGSTCLRHGGGCWKDAVSSRSTSLTSRNRSPGRRKAGSNVPSSGSCGIWKRLSPTGKPTGRRHPTVELRPCRTTFRRSSSRNTAFHGKRKRDPSRKTMSRTSGRQSRIGVTIEPRGIEPDERAEHDGKYCGVKGATRGTSSMKRTAPSRVLLRGQNPSLSRGSTSSRVDRSERCGRRSRSLCQTGRRGTRLFVGSGSR